MRKGNMMRQSVNGIGRRVRSESRKLSEMNSFILLCFGVIGAENVVELSERTKLSKSTIYRIINKQFTLNSRIGTLAKIEDAAGLRLMFASNGEGHVESISR